MLEASLRERSWHYYYHYYHYCWIKKMDKNKMCLSQVVKKKKIEHTTTTTTTFLGLRNIHFRTERKNTYSERASKILICAAILQHMGFGVLGARDINIYIHKTREGEKKSTHAHQNLSPFLVTSRLDKK